MCLWFRLSPESMCVVRRLSCKKGCFLVQLSCHRVWTKCTQLASFPTSRAAAAATQAAATCAREPWLGFARGALKDLLTWIAAVRARLVARSHQHVLQEPVVPLRFHQRHGEFIRPASPWWEDVCPRTSAAGVRLTERQRDGQEDRP